MGQGLLSFKISRSHTTTHQSIGLLWTHDQLVAETSTWQHTTLTTDRHHAAGEIRTHNLCRWVAADLSPRPRGGKKVYYAICNMQRNESQENCLKLTDCLSVCSDCPPDIHIGVAGTSFSQLRKTIMQCGLQKLHCRLEFCGSWSWTRKRRRRKWRERKRNWRENKTISKQNKSSILLKSMVLHYSDNIQPTQHNLLVTCLKGSINFSPFCSPTLLLFCRRASAGARGLYAFHVRLLTCVCSGAPEQETRNEGRIDLTAGRRIDVLCFVTAVFVFVWVWGDKILIRRQSCQLQYSASWRSNRIKD